MPPLLDDRATGDAIEALVTDELTSLEASDSLVVFFAGHGGTRTQCVGGRDVRTGYLIPVDGTGDPHRVNSWIELDPWLRRISKLPPRHILVILDACFSGIALSSAVKWGRDSGALLGLPFAAANARQSRLVITSALDNEQAMDEGPMPGHSLFTGCLIEALTGGVSPVGMRDGRHVIIGSELGHYVRYRVQTYPGRPGWRQTPDLGTFDFDERGEMLIPVLTGDMPAPPTSLARGSAGRIAERSRLPAEPTVIELANTEPSLLEAAAIAAMALEAAAIEVMAIEAMASRAPATQVAARDSAGPEAAVNTVLEPPAPEGEAAAAVTVLDLETVSAAPRATRRPRRRRWRWFAVAIVAAVAGVAVALMTRNDASVDEPAATPLAGTASSAREGMGALEPSPATLPVGPAANPAATERPAALSRVGSANPRASEPSVATPSGGPATNPRAPEPSPAAPSAGFAASTGAVSPRQAAMPSARSATVVRDAVVAPKPSVTAPAAGARHPASATPVPPPAWTCPTPIEAPRGAEVTWNDMVVTVPAQMALPCDVEVTLTFRKPHYVTATKAVTPTAGGRPVSARLQKVMASMEIRSTPPGATISIGRRAAGVTPTTVKLPEFETSTVTLTKGGYQPVTRRVAPSENGGALEVALTPLAPTSP